MMMANNLCSRRRDGFLIVMVLVTIVILSLSVYTFTALMQIEEKAARLATRRIQSKYLVDSGVDHTRLFLSLTAEQVREKGGVWQNPLQFQGIPVAVQSDNPGLRGYFSIVASSMDELGVPEGYRFGLMDESNKINLNAMPYTDAWIPDSGRSMLLALPEMTEETADAILDWLDADDDPRDYGTEGAYYRSEEPPYDAKNGPLDSLDELLLIRGVTPQLLFGLDTNRNGILDDDEAASNDVSSIESDMQLGWANYLTLYSNESNLNGEGLPRVNINADDLEQLYDDLKSAYNDDWANFIIYYRTSDTMPTTTPPTEASAVIESAAKYPLDLGALTSKRKFINILELMGTFVKVDDPENLFAYVASPIQLLNMGITIPIAMENLTTYEGTAIPGRINIMQAPRRVLEGIPGMGAEIIDQIIQVREFELDDPDGIDKNRQYETWIMVEGIVDLNEMKTLIPFICTGGDVYQAEIVGYFGDGAGTSRAEVVLDTTIPVPRILFWRDKSHLPASHSVDSLGLELEIR
jgi:hypothetical protein